MAQAPGAHATVQLLSEKNPVRPGGSFLLGVSFGLEAGWHIYWINPGDSGEPPKITWQLPASLHAGETIWPAPERLAHGSIVDYGYDGGVLLVTPIQVDPGAAVGRKLTIGAHVSYLVCREICIPAKARLSLNVRVEHVAKDLANARFPAALRAAPKQAPAAWKVSAASEKDAFALSVRNGRRAHNVRFFPLDPDVIENAAPQQLAPLPHGFRLRIEKSRLLTKPPSRLRGLIEIDGGRAIEISAPIR